MQYTGRCEKNGSNAHAHLGRGISHGLAGPRGPLPRVVLPGPEPAAKRRQGPCTPIQDRRRERQCSDLTPVCIGMHKNAPLLL
jgi:hypothetical protein